MRWMSENYPRKYTYAAIYRAEKNGDLPLVKWLHTTSTYNTSIAMLKAARRGHVEIAQWLLDNRQASSDEQPGKAIHVAIPLGQLGVLASSVSGPYPSNQWFCAQTASGARVIENANINKLFPSRGFDDYTHVLDFAVFNGDISLVQRLYADGELRRDANLDGTASLAARLGRLDMLQWLHDECDVEFSARTIYLAARSGCLGTLHWIHTCATSETVDSDILLRAGVASTR